MAWVYSTKTSTRDPNRSFFTPRFARSHSSQSRQFPSPQKSAKRAISKLVRFNKARASERVRVDTSQQFCELYASPKLLARPRKSSLNLDSGENEAVVVVVPPAHSPSPRIYVQPAAVVRAVFRAITRASRGWRHAMRSGLFYELFASSERF